MMTEKKQSAFLKAYAPCHDDFAKYCTTLAFGKMEADDLMQDVLLSAYKHFEKIKNKEQFLHYLIRAARNRSVSYWRKAQFQTELSETHTHHLVSKEVTPETILDIQLLHQTINLLPQKQRDALLLFEISGFSMKEIAQMQNSNVGAIKTKISRGRTKLRKMMSEKGIPVTVLTLLFVQNGISNVPIQNVEPLVQQLEKMTIQPHFSSTGQAIWSEPVSNNWFNSLFLNTNILNMSTISISTIIITGVLFFFAFPGNVDTNLPSPPSRFVAEKSIVFDFENDKEQATSDVVSQKEASITFKNVSPKSIFQEKANTLSDTSKPVKKIVPPVPSIEPKEPLLPKLKLKEPVPPTPKLKESLFPPVQAEKLLFPPVAPKPSLFPPVEPTAPLFEKGKGLEDIFTEPQLPLVEEPSLAPDEENETWEMGCDKSQKFDGNLILFKKALTRKLKKNDLFSANIDKKIITFKNDKVRLNGKFIPDNLQQSYLDFLDGYNIDTCPKNIVVITSKYVAVGIIAKNRFQGGVRGSINLDELNAIKID